MIPNEHCLTDQQLRWVEEYLVDGNPVAAARRAGSSAASAARTGQRNANNPAIQAFLLAQQKVLTQVQLPSREEVMAGLQHAHELARQQGNPAAMLRAAAACAELQGIKALDINDQISQDKELNPLMLKYASEATLLSIMAERQSIRAALADPEPPAASSSPGSTDLPVVTGTE